MKNNKSLSGYKKGGTIHIKPENKGKFNATKKATGKTTEELTHSKNPLTRKRAIFAQNAKKWKHGDGGLIEYDMGGPVKDVTSSSLNLIVPGLGTATSTIDSLSTNPDGSPKEGKLAQYVSRTNPLTNIGRLADGKDVGRSLLGLTGIGGLAEVTGLNDKLFGESDYDIAARKAKEIEDSKNKTVIRMGQPNSSTLNITGTNNNMYPHGGVVETDQPGAIAELELQEQMQLPNGTVMGVDGPSHENGGVEVNVPEGTRVFSDRLKHEGKTFAKHAKSLNNKIAKLDKKPDSIAKSNTEMLINKQLDNLFNTQEEMKTLKAQKKIFANGGAIPAHNVTLMKNGGLTHYSGVDGNPGVILGPYDPSQHLRGTRPIMSYSSGYDYDYMTDPNINKIGANAAKAKASWNDNSALEADIEQMNNSKFNISPQNSAFATQLLTNLLQAQQANSVKAPRTIKSVNFTAGPRPDKVSYSAERAAVDSEVAGARAGLKLGSGSYSTQAANLQKIRNQQLMAKGRSFQTEKNTNTQLDNAYKAQQAAAYNQGVQANLGIDQYNLENSQNYALWKAGQRMKSLGSTGDTLTNMFNNQTAYQNQMNYWDVMKQMYEPKVAEDIKIKKKFGGTIKTLKK